MSEERAGGDGFRRTVTQPLLQWRLVAVAALAAECVRLLTCVDGALRGGHSRESAVTRALTSHEPLCEQAVERLAD